MIPLLISTAVAVVLGWLVWLLCREEGPLGGWHVFAITMAMIVIVNPLTVWIGSNIATSSAIDGYVEYWGGNIVEAKVKEITCHRDGSCKHEYPCDPYTVWETETYVDSDGEVQTRSVQKQKNRYCPYVTHEYHYVAETSFGDEVYLARHRLAEEPEEWRPRDGRGIPSAERGTPDDWQEIRDSLDEGIAPPATKTNKYENYLLASSEALTRAYSDDIEFYRELELLPDHTREPKDAIYDDFYADKFVTVGMELENDAAWQGTLMHLNASLGAQLQGDLHVIAVGADLIDDPDAYANALLAYWQSEEYGKHALAKNAIMLVIGVEERDGEAVVAWSRADTGIPIGNGAMLEALKQRLKGEVFNPETLLGRPVTTIDKDGLHYELSDGIVDTIVTADHPYARPCMTCADEGEEGGFVYLEATIKPSGWAQFWMIVTSSIIMAAGWFGVMWFVDYNYPTGRRYYY